MTGGGRERGNWEFVLPFVRGRGRARAAQRSAHRRAKAKTPLPAAAKVLVPFFAHHPARLQVQAERASPRSSTYDSPQIPELNIWYTETNYQWIIGFDGKSGEIFSDGNSPRDALWEFADLDSHLIEQYFFESPANLPSSHTAQVKTGGRR